MSVRLNADPAPNRPLSRDLRSEAERTFFLGMDALAGVALSFDGICLADTPAKARILADMLAPGLARLQAAQDLLNERAGQR